MARTAIPLRRSRVTESTGGTLQQIYANNTPVQPVGSAGRAPSSTERIGPGREGQSPPPRFPPCAPRLAISRPERGHLRQFRDYNYYHGDAVTLESERSEPHRVDGHPSAAERRAIVEMAGAFALRDIAPRVAEYDRAEQLPTDLLERDGRARLLRRRHPRRARRARARLRHLRRADRGDLEDLPDPRARWCRCRPAWSARASSDSARRSSRRAGSGRSRRGRSSAPRPSPSPGSGSDVAGMTTTYRRDGDDFVLNGAKAWISNLDIASFFVTFATSDRSLRHRGVTAFIVPARHAGPRPAPLQGQARLPAALHRRGRARRRPSRARGAARGARAGASRSR